MHASSADFGGRQTFMNLFMMYEESDESAAAGAKLGQAERARTARGWALAAAPMLPAKRNQLCRCFRMCVCVCLCLCIDIQFEINQTLRLARNDFIARRESTAAAG